MRLPRYARNDKKQISHATASVPLVVLTQYLLSMMTTSGTLAVAEELFLFNAFTFSQRVIARYEAIST
jgi:hypothetical protein